MPGFTHYEQKGQKLDFDNLIYNVDPEETPFVSSVGKKSADSTFVQWQEDALAAPNANNAQVVGFDPTAATVSPTVPRGSYTQIVQKTFQIADSTDAVKTYGREKETAYQKVKAGKELRRDVEAICLSGQATAVGSSSVAAKTASIQAQIDASLVKSPGTAATMTQANFLEVMQKVYTGGGRPTVSLVKPADANVISGWATSNGSSRVMNDKNTTLTGAVDVYRTPYGTVTVQMDPWIKTSDALIYDPKMIELKWLRPMTDKELAKTGDSTKIMIVGEFALKNNSQRAHGLLSNLT